MLWSGIYTRTKVPKTEKELFLVSCCLRGGLFNGNLNDIHEALQNLQNPPLYKKFIEKNNWTDLSLFDLLSLYIFVCVGTNNMLENELMYSY